MFSVVAEPTLESNDRRSERVARAHGHRLPRERCGTRRGSDPLGRHVATYPSTAEKNAAYGVRVPTMCETVGIFLSRDRVLESCAEAIRR